MKFKPLFVLIGIALSFSVFAQQLPIDFTSNTNSFSGFSGSNFAFRTASPSSSANRGGQFHNNGNDAYQGFFIDMASPIVLDNTNQIFSLEFYAFDPNAHTMLLKLEDASNTDAQVRATNIVSANNWTTVQFDFSNAVASDGSTPVNTIGSYSRLVVFIDDGATQAGTYVIDDINNGAVSMPPVNTNTIDVVYSDLVWSDEFDGANGAINATKWHHQTQIPNGGNWYNGEEQHYTNRNDNSKVENGFLIITAKKENFNDQGYTKQYTSARLNSKFAFTNGRVDVRAKLPFGEGTWPAIWTLGKNINEDGAYWDNQGFDTTSWPACGEIDIMEHGLHSVNEVSVALHTPSSFGNTMNNAQQNLADVANDFHVYSMNWSPDKIVFLIDDVPFYTYNPASKNANNWPFTEDQYLLLNIAMGGISGAIDSNFTESEMVVDYVRVYQNNSLNVEENEISNFEVFPNPASDQITILSSLTIDKLTIYNSLGQDILTQSNSQTLDVSGVKPGLYILNIQSGRNIETKKIIIN